MFNPKLSSEAAPVRLVGAATERGPIAPSTPVNTLTRAKKDQVAQAQSGIRKLDDDRPVPKVDVFGAISSIAGSVGQGLRAVGVGQGDNLTQAQRDDAVLKPYAQTLDKLQRARAGGVQGIDSRVSIEISSFIKNNPRLRGQALELAATLTGVETAVEKSLNLEDINLENKSNWLKNTAQGRTVAARASKLPVNQQAILVDKEYNMSQVQAATIEQAAIRLKAAEGDDKLFEIESKNQASVIAKEQSRQIQDLLANELLPETTNPNEIFDLQEELSGLRQLRELKAAEFLQEYPGVRVEDVEQNIAQVMAPLDRMIDMLEAGGDDIQKLADTQGAQAVLELGKMAQEEGLGPVFQTKQGIEALASTLLYSPDSLIGTETVAKAYKDRYLVAPEDGVIVETPSPDSPTPADTLSPAAKKFYGDNPPARRDLIQISSNTMNGPELDTPKNIKTSFDAGMELIGAISAKEDVLDDQSFGQFVDQNLFRFTQLATLPGEQGETFTRALNGMLVKQMAINTFRTKEVLNQLPSGFVLVYDKEFKLEFNMEAFNRAEDSVTRDIKTALKENNLPVIEDNIRAILEDTTLVSTKPGELNPSQVNFQSLTLGSKSMKRVQSRLNRLNNIDSAATSIPTINGWKEEVTAATLRSEEDFFSSEVTKASVVTAKDKKLAEENNASLPSFNSDLEVQEAITNGNIKIGDRVKVGNKVYDVEEDDGDS